MITFQIAGQSLKPAPPLVQVWLEQSPLGGVVLRAQHDGGYAFAVIRLGADGLLYQYGGLQPLAKVGIQLEAADNYAIQVAPKLSVEEIP